MLNRNISSLCMNRGEINRALAIFSFVVRYLVLFIPFLLIFKGDLAQCSEAADRLTKKQVNPEIESDYERGPDENQSTQITGKTSVSASSTALFFLCLDLATTSTITTLRNVPFGGRSLYDWKLECSFLNAALQFTPRMFNRSQHLHPRLHDPMIVRVRLFFSFNHWIQMLFQDATMGIDLVDGPCQRTSKLFLRMSYSLKRQSSI